MNDRKRNYLLIFMDTVLFFNAMTFLSVNAVITLFLANMGASTLDVGLVNALVSIGAFASQPVFAKMVMNSAHKAKVFVKILFIQRITFLAFVFTIPFIAESHPKLMVMLFLVCWAIFSLFVGAYGPFYMSLFAKFVAERERGRLRGYSGGAANLLSLGSAALCGVILSKLPYPYNYTLIFTIGVVLLLLDALVFALMKEMEADEIRKVDFNYFQYFKAIPSLFREFKPFRRSVLGFSFTVAAQAGLAYYALFSVRTFQAGTAEIALFTAITGLANITGSVVFGILADKIGHRLVLVLASLSGGLASLLIVAFPSMGSVYAAFALTNLCMCGYNLCSGILIIEQIPRQRLPMGISVNAMITLIVSAIVTIGSSVLADHFSFYAVFWIAGLSGLAGAVILVRADNPRRAVQHSSGQTTERR